MDQRPPINSFAPLRTDVATAAQRLLGGVLERTIDERVVRVMIVETEAYDQSDAASHSYGGKTPRTSPMFDAAGRAYVYYTYGMHHCFNIVVGEPGYGAGVLIRAVEPLNHTDVLSARRNGRLGVQLTNGPAKLCQALGIDRSMTGHNLSDNPLRLILQPPLDSNRVVVTTRVGISRAQDVPWRFYVKGNSFVSVLATK